MAPHRRARLGLVRTFQSVELFDDLTVRDNLRAAANRRTVWQSLRDLVAPRWHDDESVDRPGARRRRARRRRRRPPDRAVARAAQAGRRRPRPGLSSAPAAARRTGRRARRHREHRRSVARLRDVVDDGVSILLVDHDMGLVLGTCDQIVVLDFGRVLADGDARSDPERRAGPRRLPRRRRRGLEATGRPS